MRRLYYRSLFSVRAPAQNIIAIWDFPSYLHYDKAGLRLFIPFDAPLPRPLVDLGGGLPANVHASEWLLQDFFLNDVLTAMGLTWEIVEEAMADAFFNALPPKFREIITPDDPHGFLLWKRELERWWYFSGHEVGTMGHIKGLRRSIAKTPYVHQFAGVFRYLEALVTPAPWTQTLTHDLPMFLGNESPIIQPVNKALDAVVWGGIKYQQVPPAMPDFARHIYDQKTDSKNCKGRRPEEYWMFLADILYHLRLVRGLPTLKRGLDAVPTMLPAQSANAVRLSATRPLKEPKNKERA